MCSMKSGASADMSGQTNRLHDQHTVLDKHVQYSCVAATVHEALKTTMGTSRQTSKGCITEDGCFMPIVQA